MKGIEGAMNAVREWETWDNLRTLMASRLVQSTVAVPVIGYVILFSAGLQEYLRLTIDPALTVNAGRMYFLYFGFSALAVSAIIFNLRCPAEVRHHGSAYDFVDKQERIMTRGRIKALYETLFTLQLIPPREGGPLRKEDYPNIMTTYFEYLEEIRPKSRRAVLATYVVGVVLLLVPTMQTFYLVARAAVRAVLGTP